MTPLAPLACVLLHLAYAVSTLTFDTAAATAPRVLPQGSPPYDFSAPVSRFELPDELVEISGLALLDEGHVAAIEDEHGDLFVISLRDGSVDSRTPFGKTGDYEGIERVGERLFVMTSGGEVSELLDWRRAIEREITIATRLFDLDLGAKRCNAEGLGTDGRRLLIACKNEDDSDRNRVYAVDLSRLGERDTDVAFKLHADDVPGGKKSLRPSAIAIHPITGQTIVLSSKREALLCLDECGRVREVWDIAPADLEQPEGLAFLPDGDALISSEGKDDAAVLARFAWRG